MATLHIVAQLGLFKTHHDHVKYGSISPYSNWPAFASSVYSFCMSRGCHIMKLSLTDCLVNAEKYWFVRTSFRSVRTSELQSEYFSTLTAQSINKSLFPIAGEFINLIS